MIKALERASLFMIFVNCFITLGYATDLFLRIPHSACFPVHLPFLADFPVFYWYLKLPVNRYLILQGRLPVFAIAVFENSLLLVCPQHRLTEFAVADFH